MKLSEGKLKVKRRQTLPSMYKCAELGKEYILVFRDTTAPGAFRVAVEHEVYGKLERSFITEALLISGDSKERVYIYITSEIQRSRMLHQCIEVDGYVCIKVAYNGVAKSLGITYSMPDAPMRPDLFAGLGKDVESFIEMLPEHIRIVDIYNEPY